MKKLFLVQKGGYWYRPNSQGYTGVPADAGLYNEEEAIAHCTNTKGVEYVRLDAVLEGDLLKRLQTAQIASCTCGTKTPVADYHAPDCIYRILYESEQVIRRAIVQRLREEK